MASIDGVLFVSRSNAKVFGLPLIVWRPFGRIWDSFIISNIWKWILMQLLNAHWQQYTMRDVQISFFLLFRFGFWERSTPLWFTWQTTMPFWGCRINSWQRNYSEQNELVALRILCVQCQRSSALDLHFARLTMMMNLSLIKCNVQFIVQCLCFNKKMNCGECHIHICNTTINGIH